jgi:hypothetical protein
MSLLRHNATQFVVLYIYQIATRCQSYEVTIQYYSVMGMGRVRILQARNHSWGPRSCYVGDVVCHSETRL